jgi:uncharacterized protein YbjT (DUF2867 family)
MPRMIVVTGAAGNIGLPLVQMLRGGGHAMRVIARDPARATKLLGPDVTIADAASPDALAGAAKAFFLGHPSPTLGDEAGAFAARAKAAGIAHVVAISSGTIAMQPATTIGRWHAELEDHLRATGIAWTLVRPGNFASNALRWAGTIRAKSSVVMAKPDAPSAPIDPYDIAAVAYAALVQDGHAGKTYSVQGPDQMTARQQVAVIAEAIGRVLDVVEVPPEQARAGMIGAGMAPQMADAIVELLGRSDPQLTTTVHDITGVAPRSFATWVAANRAAFATG